VSIIAYKNKVALAPFAKTGVQAQVTNGFAKMAHKSSLEALEVVFGNGADLYPGDVVFVHADGAKSWGKDEFDVEGKTVVLCPLDKILLVKQRPPQTLAVPPKPAPTSAPGPGTLRTTS
jgi:hypothetical protein